MSFVEVITQPHCQKGTGKLIKREGNSYTIEWFIMPGQRGEAPVVVRETLEHSPLRSTIRVLKSLPKQQRVYWQDPLQQGQWLVGRIDEDGGLPLRGNRNYNSGDEFAYVRVSGGYIDGEKHARVPANTLYVRSLIAHQEAHEYTKILWAENPLLGKPRAEFRKEYIDQRATFRGMTGLASSSIKMLEYQIDVVQHILNAPIQRFILGDEVGLGKTIEALAILRQYYLDGRVNRTQLLDVVQRDIAQDPLKALLVVPETLVKQWKEEIDRRIDLSHLIFDLDSLSNTMKDEFICVASYEEFEKLDLSTHLNALIVDEVHLLCRDVESAVYTKLHEVSETTERVLLLSATPIVDNVEGYFNMLSVLDPVLYPRNDENAYQSFVTRFEKQLEIASIWNSLDESVSLDDEERLRELFVGETSILAVLDEYVDICDKLDDIDASLKLSEGTNNTILLNEKLKFEEEYKVCLVALQFLIAEVGRLDNRIIRNRREKNLDKLPNRNGLEVIEHECSLRSEVHRFIHAWLNLLHEQQIDSSAVEWNLFKNILGHFFGNPRMSIISLKDEDLQPSFSELIDAYRHNIEVLEDGRLVALLKHLRQLVSESYNAIVFLPESLIDIVSQVLETDDIDVFNAVMSSDVNNFRMKGGIILCPPASETGLNLQDLEAELVMYNLPLRTERIEQRLGRVDRLGSILEGDTFVTTILCANTELDQGWLDVIEATQIFTLSISPIQNRILEQEEVFWAELNTSGRSVVGAISRLCQTLQEKVVSWHNTVRSYDALSAIRFFDAQYKEIRKEIENDNKRQVWKQVLPWIRQLQFKIEDKKSQRYQFLLTIRNRGVQTLVPKNALWNVVPFDYWYCEVKRKGSDIYERKIQAQSRKRFYEQFDVGASICRIGSPMFEVLNQICLTDDRGVSVAYSKPAQGHVKGVFFKVSILVEGALHGEYSSFKRRNLDYFIPPKMFSIWVDQQGEVVKDSKTIAFLEVYNDLDEQHINLKRGSERWKAHLNTVDVLLSDWDERVDYAVLKVKEHVQTSLQPIKDVQKSNVTHFFTHKIQVMKARSEDIENIETKYKELLKQIKDPRLFCDAIQTVVLR